MTAVIADHKDILMYVTLARTLPYPYTNTRTTIDKIAQIAAKPCKQRVGSAWHGRTSDVMFQPKVQNPKLAALLITSATAFIAASTLLGRALSYDQFDPPLHPIQISHERYAFSFPGISLALAALRPRLPKCIGACICRTRPLAGRG